MKNATAIRTIALSVSIAVSLVTAMLFLDNAAPGGIQAIDWLRLVLVMLTGFWLAWGCSIGIMGLFRSARAEVSLPAADLPPPLGRTIVLVPVYNEDPGATFSRIAAMNASLVGLGLAGKFHFAVLSDTTSPRIAISEARWFRRLLAEPFAEGRVFYRRRTQNLGRKAGNIEDFIRRSGAAYDYALILDADSLMEGATMAEMARRMDRNDRLGLLQTLPKIINASTVFGRTVQFSASYLAPTFAGGLALTQGHEGPFWGHNAIVRIRAFASSCGLPELSGKPPFGGHILSHDYVEAAMLARAGWKVELDPDLGGSYEEGPENLVEFAKRDRRWCQGNLQHGRLIAAPGLKFWNRFTLLQGVMAYLASPLWLMLLFATIVAAALPQRPFIDQRLVAIGNHAAWELMVGITLLLVLPRLLILARGAFSGENHRFGGTVRTIASALAEIVLSTLLAPLMLLLQSRAVGQVLLGIDGGWPATRRNARWLDLADGWTHSWWIVAFGLSMLALTMAAAPHIVGWMLPAIVPMMAAPLLISASSLDASRGVLAHLFLTPEEAAPSPVVAGRRAIEDRWQSVDLTKVDAPAPLEGQAHVRA